MEDFSQKNDRDRAALIDATHAFKNYHILSKLRSIILYMLVS